MSGRSDPTRAAPVSDDRVVSALASGKPATPTPDDRATSNAPHVAVIGGGIAGLATAWYLQTLAGASGKALRCTLFEASDRCGGKVLTETVEHEGGTFVVEGGPDSFLNGQKPWAAQLAAELGLARRLIGTNDAARKVFVLNRGKPVPLPDGVFLLVPTRFWPFVSSPLITPWGKLRMGMDLVLPARRDDGDETMADFVRRRLGGEALDKIAEPLLAGIYSAEAERQSILATFPRFRELERHYGSLTRGMLAARRRSQPAAGPAGETAAAGHDIPRTIFLSFQKGTAELTDELAVRLARSVHLGVRVAGLERAGDAYRLRLQAPRGEDVCEADVVVAAMPASVTADLLRDQAPSAAAELGAIRYVDTGVVSLGYRAADVAQRFGFGVLVPRSERRPINAVTLSSTKFDGRAPAGHLLLRVFFGGSRSPQSMDLDDDDLLRMVRAQLRELLGIGEPPLFHRIHRWWQANPQYDVGHLALVERVRRGLPDGIYVTGSPYLGVGLPDCVRQAKETAQRVLEALPCR
jgi:oxygen-dependent protoporphyrinogen oxidase